MHRSNAAVVKVQELPVTVISRRTCLLSELCKRGHVCRGRAVIPAQHHVPLAELAF